MQRERGREVSKAGQTVRLQEGGRASRVAVPPTSLQQAPEPKGDGGPEDKVQAPEQDISGRATF